MVCGMIYTDAEFAAACAAHDVGFDLFGPTSSRGLRRVEEVL
jgi:hypothetical protein